MHRHASTDEEEVSAALGHALRQLRRAAPLSQVDLCRALDVDQTAVSRWERGTDRFPALLIPRMERALDVPPGTLWASAGLLALTSVPAAIYADQDLEPKEKAMMVSIYSTLVGQTGGSGSVDR